MRAVCESDTSCVFDPRYTKNENATVGACYLRAVNMLAPSITGFVGSGIFFLVVVSVTGGSRLCRRVYRLSAPIEIDPRDDPDDPAYGSSGRYNTKNCDLAQFAEPAPIHITVYTFPVIGAVGTFVACVLSLVPPVSHGVISVWVIIPGFVLSISSLSLMAFVTCSCCPYNGLPPYNPVVAARRLAKLMTKRIAAARPTAVSYETIGVARAEYFWTQRKWFPVGLLVLYGSLLVVDILLFVLAIQINSECTGIDDPTECDLRAHCYTSREVDKDGQKSELVCLSDSSVIIAMSIVSAALIGVAVIGLSISYCVERCRSEDSLQSDIEAIQGRYPDMSLENALALAREGPTRSSCVMLPMMISVGLFLLLTTFVLATLHSNREILPIWGAVLLITALFMAWFGTFYLVCGTVPDDSDDAVSVPLNEGMAVAVAAASSSSDHVRINQRL